MANDFLDQKRDEIAARIGELRPLVAEYQRLRAAADAIDAIPGSAGSPARERPARRAPSPIRGDRTTPAKTGARGRPKDSGRRGEQALAVITAHPGITVADLAQKMGIKQNYLYRVLPVLAADQRVRKEGRGWHPQPTR